MDLHKPDFLLKERVATPVRHDDLHSVSTHYYYSYKRFLGS